VVAKLQFPDGSWEQHGVVAIVVAIAVTALIGLFQGSFVAIIGVPSFVVTLAGLLFWQGVIQYTIGDQGVIVIDDSLINNVANYFFSDTAGYLIAVIVSGLYLIATLAGVISRRRHGINTDNLVLVSARIAGLAAIAFGAVYWANQERGFPVAFLLVIVLLVFWTWVAERTTFGRHVYAVGGNAEAARRAGINVRRVRLVVFMISGAMAGLGGVILASRLNSVDLNAGGGTLLLDAIAAAVIGGTSLFGGRGRVISALMGSLVIATLANGIDLAGWSSAIKFMVTGAILLFAVTLDTLLRRRLQRAGR
jgi:D-xylose transport system permease protein